MVRHLAAVIVVFSLGCGDRPSMTQPTPLPPASAPLEFTLTGSVADSAFRSLSDARVEVIAGTKAGIVATTDHFGRFRLEGTFTDTVTVRASKNGYLSEATTVPPAFPSDRYLPPPPPGDIRHWDVYLSLQPEGPSANLAGTYTLTLSTDSACANFPDEARTRTYTATFAPGYRSTTFVGTVSDARMVRSIYSPYFQINVAGNFARVTVGFVERLDETRYLAIDGAAAAPVSPSGIAAPLNAAILHCPNEPVWTSGEYWACASGVQGAECNSVNHRLQLLRR